MRSVTISHDMPVKVKVKDNTEGETLSTVVAASRSDARLQPMRSECRSDLFLHSCKLQSTFMKSSYLSQMLPFGLERTP